MSATLAWQAGAPPTSRAATRQLSWYKASTSERLVSWSFSSLKFRLAPQQAYFRPETRQSSGKIVIKFRSVERWRLGTLHDPGASRATALDVTECLLRWRDGDSDALPELTDLVYGELRRLASVFLKGEASGHTLQPTALVHELYLHIEGVREMDWKCRAQFFAISARMMRNILVDHAHNAEPSSAAAATSSRFRTAISKPVATPISFWSMWPSAVSRPNIPRQAQVVELRFFGGLTLEETAEALKIDFENTSLRTVERDWRFARAWLLNEIRSA